MSGFGDSALSMWSDPDELLEALDAIGADDKYRLIDRVRLLVDHEDPDVREEVLRILFITWKSKEDRNVVLDRLQHDDHVDVKAAAALALAAVSDESSRRDDSRLLLDMLQSSDEDEIVKASAYDALLIIHRRAAFPTKLKPFRAARDVDWEWIRSLGQSNGNNL